MKYVMPRTFSGHTAFSKRTNSNKRSAHGATVGDIVNAMYNLDQEEKLPDIFVAISGIGRQPQFNPESITI